MTIKAVEWALKQDGVSSTAKLVLVMLADCINGNDEFAWPSQARIATVVGRKERQVRNHLKALCEAGLVRCEGGAGAGRGKGREATRYYLACDHRTGVSRPLTTGNDLPAANVVTTGNQSPPVSVTTGNSESLQPAISGVLPYIDKPEEEPEPKSRSKKRDGEGKKKSPKAKAGYSPEFNAIWLSWPAHRRANSDKKTAFKRYLSGVEQFGHDPIAAAARYYLSQPDTKKQNYQYCCLVEVFMNGKLEAAVEAAAEAPESRGEEWDPDVKAWVRA